MALLAGGINQNLVIDNDKFDRKWFDRFVDYTRSRNGASRFLSVMRSAARLRNAIGESPSRVATQLDKACSSSSVVLGFVGLPSTTKDAYDSVINVRKNDGISVERKTTVAVRDSLEALTSWSNLGSFIYSHKIFDRTAQVADLGSDTADLCLSVTDWQAASTYEAQAQGEVKEALQHTRKYYMLRIAKAVLAVASAIFTVITIITGLRLLPVVAGLIMSLATSLLAIRRDFFKEEGKYQLFDLSKPVRMV